MISAIAVRNLLLSNIDGTALWRKRRAVKTTVDRGDHDAATHLSDLSDALRSQPCGSLLNQIAHKCNQSDHRTLLRLSEVEWDLLREIGFSVTFSSADEYLRALIDRFSKIVPKISALGAESKSSRSIVQSKDPGITIQRTGHSRADRSFSTPCGNPRSVTRKIA